MTAAILNLKKETTEYRDFTGWNLEPQGLMEQELAHSRRRLSISRDAAQTKTAGTAPGFTSLLPCLHLLGFHWPKLVRNRGVRTMGSLPAAPRPVGHRIEAGGGGQRQKETPRVCLRGPLTCIPPRCG